jgi:putative AdoMet-dependent methyltransferase
MRLHIHEAAKKLGTTPRAIRFYEEKGLLAPVKSPENGYRLYDEADLTRLRWIVALRDLGLPVAAIKEVLDEDPDDVRLLARLDEARQEIYREWINLSQALKSLDAVLSAGYVRRKLAIDDVAEAAGRIRDAAMLRDAWRDRMGYDRLAADYREQAVTEALRPYVDERAYEWTHAAIAQWLDPAADERGVDLGAGTGRLTARLSALGAQMTAVEQSAEMLSVLRELQPEVEAKLGNLLALPFQEPTFDFAVCSFALHSLDARQQLLAVEEIDRVLLKGGRLCLAGAAAINPGSPGVPPDIDVRPDRGCALFPIEADAIERQLISLGYNVIQPTAAKGIWLLFAVKRGG